jgi:hypothetical protein
MMEAGAGIVAASLLPARVEADQRIILNDASRLDPTPVVKHWVVGEKDRETFIARLRQELKDAAAAKRPVMASAARHSMGGQSLPRDGTAITLNDGRIELDTNAKTYRAAAGSRWREVIAALDPAGFSPAVMQSNNDFGVASTFSVNAHGWPVPFGPFGSTVRSLDMMLADGSIVTCTREQNSELFRLAMGGYGLFGVILKLEVDMVPNILLRPHYDLMPSGEFAAKFTSAAADTRIVMAYGRLSVAKDSFFDEALMVTFSPAESKGQLPSATDHGSFTFLSRRIYRAQMGSELGKHARWAAETVFNPRLSTGPSRRNSLMNCGQPCER